MGAGAGVEVGEGVDCVGVGVEDQHEARGTLLLAPGAVGVTGEKVQVNYREPHAGNKERLNQRVSDLLI